MPKKKNPLKNFKSKRVEPLKEYEQLRIDTNQSYLDIQKEINAEIEKELNLKEKSSEAYVDFIKKAQKELEHIGANNDGLIKGHKLNKKKLLVIEDQLKALQNVLKNRKKHVDTEKEINKVYEKNRETLIKTFGQVLPMFKQSYKLLNAISQNPLTAIVLMGGLAVKSFKDFSNQMDGIGQQFGALGFQSKDIQQSLGKILRDGAALDIEMRDISQVLPSISSHFGLTQQASLEIANTLIRTGRAIGISNQESERLYDILSATHDLSVDQLDTVLKQQYAWAETQDVVPSAVIRQLAMNTEFVAKNTKDMGEEMLNTAVSATKLGIELSSVEKIQNKLLNFQQSIRDEFELSVLLGRRVNLTQARGLALQGKTDDALRSVVNQMQGIDLKNLDVLTIQKISEATGVAVTDIQKMVNRGEDLNSVMKATGSSIDSMDVSDINAESAVSESTKMSNTIKNIGRSVNEQLVDGFGKIENIIGGVRAGLTSVLATVNSIGIANVAFVTSLAMSVRYARQLNMELAKAKYTGKGGGPTSFFQRTKGGKFDKRTGFGRLLNQTKKGNFSGIGKMGMKGLRGLGKAAGPLAIGMAGLNAMGNISEHGVGKGSLKTLDQNKFMALGAAIGSIIPGAGTLAGAGIGGLIDMLAPTIGSYHTGTGWVPRSGRYNLRAGEAVIPKSRNVSSAMGGISSMGTSAVSSGGNVKIELSDETLSKMMFGQVKANQMYGLPNQTSQRIKESTQMTNQIWAIGAA